MGEQLISSITTVLAAIISLAIIATLVSKNANTSQVTTAAGNAFSSSILAAESPVTGGSGLGNLSNAGTMNF